MLYRAFLVLMGLLIAVSGCMSPSNQMKAEVTDSVFIRTAFQKADSFMETDHYDSAQVWLNYIHKTLSYRQPGRFSYFLTSRQAEIYYYNNLLELGKQEAMRAQHIATAMQDSALLLDAYNFIGLFNLRMEMLPQAALAFKKGLLYAQEVPDDDGYTELSKPLHLYGNLAEKFEKENAPDSAIYYGYKSLEEAVASKHKRGIGTAYINIGFGLLRMGDNPESIRSFERALFYSRQSDDFDVELAAYAGLATAFAQDDRRNSALTVLDSGLFLQREHPQVNSYYTLLFLDHAEALYRKYAVNSALIYVMDRKAAVIAATSAKSAAQLQFILQSSLANEKRIFDMELAEADIQKELANRRFYVTMLIVVILLLVFLFYRYFLQERLKLATLRNRISRDLHDEVGATLSGIAMYAHITREKIKQGQVEEVDSLLEEIRQNSVEMSRTLNDIVWAVDPIQDNLLALVHRLLDFAQGLSDAKDINFEGDIQGNLELIKVSMQYRRNFYLIGKEAINNAVKYSSCKHLKVQVMLTERKLELHVEDDGTGFDYAGQSDGNGLVNMTERAKQIDARLTVDTQPGNGTRIMLCSPISSIKA